ncbi:MAG: alkaline phosphatase family protein [bacterium]|nr:alkaline phosphatase family protein [bacterium]
MPPTGESVRRGARVHLEYGLAAGMLIGTLMGLAATSWNIPASFLFSVANEILVTFVYRYVSPELSAEMAVPSTFFGIHFLIGTFAGAALGAAVGLLFRGKRWRYTGSLYAFLLVTPVMFMYTLLWFFHGKFQGDDHTRGILAVTGLAIVTGVAAALVTGVAGRLAGGLRASSLHVGRVLRVIGAVALVGVVVTLLTGLATGFGRSEIATQESVPTRYKVMVIGIDGASWAVIRPIMDEGLMPNLQRLIREGVSGPLRSSLPPIESPTIWTSVATGKRADKHGVRGFVMRSPETKRLVPVNSLMRKSAAFWEVVSERGMEVDVVTWYVSWPAQQINGTFVSERLVFPELDHVVAPAAWSDALAHHNDTYIRERADRLKKFTPHPYNPDYRSLNRNSQAFFRDEHLSILDFTHRKDAVAFGIAKDLLYQRQPDVFAVYFEGIDRTSHRFIVHERARLRSWVARRLYSELDECELDLFRTVIRSYHEQIDRWIGSLLEEIDDETAVMILSDHGFGLRTPWKVHVNMNPLLEFLGERTYVESDDKGWVDYSKTRLFDSYQLTKALGRVMVNVKGRQPDGIVPLEEVDEVLEEARERLSNLRTTSGARVFRSVVVSRDAGTADSNGDIRVALNEDCLADSIVDGEHVFPVSRFIRAEWMPGNHRIDGIFVGCGGPFKRGASIHNAGILDIAPTLLKIAGIPPAHDMDGRALDRAFRKDVRGKLVQGVVPSYARTAFDGNVDTSSPADSLILEQLRALGYIR